mmetsp:Transcript_52417/g.162715  ORF Transcript_52417/g.162715 Transcript_52417/m.162715 type:complete len:267 (+) Transcript_52417:337-1137(+)
MLRAEAERYLSGTSRGSVGAGVAGDGAAAQLQGFLEHLDLDGEAGAFFSATAAGSGTAEVGRGRDAVTVATAHSSKGRQWPHVFVARFNDELGFPLAGPEPPSQAAEEPLPEERRLAYVAASRAGERLTISYVLSGADGRPARPSRFLAGLQPGRAPETEERRIDAVGPVEQQWLAATARRLGCHHDAASAAAGSTPWQRFLANPRKPPAPRFALRRRLPGRGTGVAGAAGGGQPGSAKRLRKASPGGGMLAGAHLPPASAVCGGA